MPPWQLLYVKIVMLLCEMRDWCGEHMTRFLCEWQDECVMIIYELNKICHLNKRRMHVTLKHPMCDKMWLNTRWQCETIQDDVYNVTMWQYNSVLNVKAVVSAFNQEKALVCNRGLLRDCENDCETDGSFYSTNRDHPHLLPAAACSDQPPLSGTRPRQKWCSPPSTHTSRRSNCYPEGLRWMASHIYEMLGIG